MENQQESAREREREKGKVGSENFTNDLKEILLAYRFLNISNSESNRSRWRWSYQCLDFSTPSIFYMSTHSVSHPVFHRQIFDDLSSKFSFYCGWRYFSSFRLLFCAAKEIINFPAREKFFSNFLSQFVVFGRTIQTMRLVADMLCECVWVRANECIFCFAFGLVLFHSFPVFNYFRNSTWKNWPRTITHTHTCNNNWRKEISFNSLNRTASATTKSTTNLKPIDTMNLFFMKWNCGFTFWLLQLWQ